MVARTMVMAEEEEETQDGVLPLPAEQEIRGEDLDEQGILGKSVHFNADQLGMLNARIDRKLLAKRSQSGRELTYIEGYTAINQANRIFGYGSWDMDVEDMTDRGWGFTALVTVFVKAPDGSESQHQDVGVGLVTSEKPESKEMAVKAAVTDGMKRAFRAFGEQFGNSLYDRSYMATRDQEDKAQAREAARVAASGGKPLLERVEALAKNDPDGMDKIGRSLKDMTEEELVKLEDWFTRRTRTRAAGS